MSTGPTATVVVPGVIVEAYSLVPPVTVEIAVQGPQGPKGDPDTTQVKVVNQYSAVTTMTISHTFGRVPIVAIYIGGRQVLCQVDATTDQVVITFSTPQAFTALLR